MASLLYIPCSHLKQCRLTLLTWECWTHRDGEWDFNWCDLAWLRENNHSYLEEHVRICHFRNQYEVGQGHSHTHHNTNPLLTLTQTHHITAQSLTLKLTHHITAQSLTLKLTHHITAQSLTLTLTHHITAQSLTLTLTHHITAQSRTLTLTHHISCSRHLPYRGP